MWWHDIKEIKSKIVRIETHLKEVLNDNSSYCCQASCSENDLLNERLDDLQRSMGHLHKDIQKFNQEKEKIQKMILEFKGCVTMSRGALVERKEINAELTEALKGTANFISKIEDIHKFFTLIKKEIQKKKQPVKKKTATVAA